MGLGQKIGHARQQGKLIGMSNRYCGMKFKVRDSSIRNERVSNNRPMIPVSEAARELTDQIKRYAKETSLRNPLDS